MANPTSLRKAGLPIKKRASSAQAAVAVTAAAVVTTGVTQSTPYGYAGATQGDAVATTINKLVVDVTALTTLVNEHRTVLINAGLAKGSA